MTTEECDADPAYKQAYLDAEEKDIVIVKSPVGMPGRAIRNRFLERVQGGKDPGEGVLPVPGALQSGGEPRTAPPGRSSMLLREI